MKISVSFKDTEITYSKPIKLPKGDLAKNIFSEVTLIGEQDHLIDIFALPGFYQTSLEMKKKTLANFFQNNDLNFDNILLEKPFFNAANENSVINPEILFDIECALFPFINYPLTEDKKVLSHAFELEKLKEAQCLKLKISPDQKYLNFLAEALNEQAKNSTLPKLRFDGNRKFELNELVSFLNKLNEKVIYKIEYIEEPFKNFYDQNSFQHQYKIPIAIDESLPYFANQLELLPKNIPIVLKPALFGISKSFELIRRGCQLGHSVIISATYQPTSTFIPLLALANYSDSFHSGPLFHGLDTLSFLPLSYINSRALNSLSIP